MLYVWVCGCVCECVGVCLGVVCSSFASLEKANLATNTAQPKCVVNDSTKGSEPKPGDKIL